MTLVKICGITRPEDARMAAKEGADFIGMIISSGFPRSVNLNKALEISDAAKSAGAKTVGLFTKEGLDQMQEAIEALKLDFVQLHTPFSLKEGAALDCARLLVNTPSYPNFREKDFYLYDKYDGQKGKGRWFLAGGLNPFNVIAAIENDKPDGVDVSSGVEKDNVGIKDEGLLKAFIRVVKHGKR